MKSSAAVTADNRPHEEVSNARTVELVVLNFVVVLMFLGVGFAAEAAGAHWLVGFQCVAGIFISCYMIMRLNGWKLGGFIMKRE
jgi:hypothetical protein